MLALQYSINRSKKKTLKNKKNNNFKEAIALRNLHTIYCSIYS